MHREQTECLHTNTYNTVGVNVNNMYYVLCTSVTINIKELCGKLKPRL